MTGATRPYALDLDALPVGAIVVASDCWGESPTAFRVVERQTHHIIGQASDGRSVFIGAALITRMAHPDEVAVFAPTVEPAPKAPQTAQMEMF